MRRADAASWCIKYPEGVVRAFQVRTNKVDPSEPVLARYLLTKDPSRSAGVDEPEPLGPEMLLVGETTLASC